MFIAQQPFRLKGTQTLIKIVKVFFCKFLICFVLVSKSYISFKELSLANQGIYKVITLY